MYIPNIENNGRDLKKTTIVSYHQAPYRETFILL